MPVGVFSAVFLLLSGLDHLAVVVPGIKSKYLEDIRQNRNRFRWIEYSCASSFPAPHLDALLNQFELPTSNFPAL